MVWVQILMSWWGKAESKRKSISNCIKFDSLLCFWMRFPCWCSFMGWFNAGSLTSPYSNNLLIYDYDTLKNLVKRKCKLWSWQKNIVAEGIIASVDPDTSVHFIKLGPNAWKVWVNVAVEPEVFLFRPNSEMSTIKEDVGPTVAWSKDFISLV